MDRYFLLSIYGTPNRVAFCPLGQTDQGCVIFETFLIRVFLGHVEVLHDGSTLYMDAIFGSYCYVDDYVLGAIKVSYDQSYKLIRTLSRVMEVSPSSCNIV